MQFHYLDRESYRKKDSPEIFNSLKNLFNDFYLLQEGGTNELAVKGCSEIINKINIDFDCICCPCGTGGTLAGLVSGLNGKKFALGFAVLKGASFLKENVTSLIRSFNEKIFSNWDINLDYHFGGYAKSNKQLTEFVYNFKTQIGIQLEPIYTGRMLFGIYDLISKGYFDEGTRIVAIHTGGLQGLSSFKK